MDDQVDKSRKPKCNLMMILHDDMIRLLMLEMYDCDIFIAVYMLTYTDL